MLQRGIITQALSKPFPCSRYIKWIISEISYTSNNLFYNKMAVLQIYIEAQPTLSIDVLFHCLWAISPLKWIPAGSVCCFGWKDPPRCIKPQRHTATSPNHERVPLHINTTFNTKLLHYALLQKEVFQISAMALNMNDSHVIKPR